jgi:hypothetical protein
MNERDRHGNVTSPHEYEPTQGGWGDCRECGKLKDDPRHDVRKAAPYEARRCPTCGLWVFTAAGPFFEDDPTKTGADYLHWEAEHATPDELAAMTISFPFFDYNTEPVIATVQP